MTVRPQDLVTCFDGLQTPTSDVGLGRFCVQRIAGYDACFIGRDVTGSPALLIATEWEDAAAYGAPLVLEWLRILHAVQCRIYAAGPHEEIRRFTVIQCTAMDRSMQVYFLRALYPIIASLPASPRREHVTQAVVCLMELFSRAQNEPKQTVMGLWAELFLIARSSRPEVLIQGWHATPEEHYDFSAGRDRIEVKAASGERVHHFSLPQLRPPMPARVVVASVLVERSQGGTSIVDLVDEIHTRVTSPDLLVGLDAVIAETIGREWRSTQELRFDRERADTSLRLVEARLIPAVSTPLPPEVSGVHFRVDISRHAEPISPGFCETSDLFSAALPTSDRPRG
jgi:hypothetical protein